MANSRVRSFEQRVLALQLLCGYLDTPEGAGTVPAWERKVCIAPSGIQLSEDQSGFIDAALALLRIDDAYTLDVTSRMLRLCLHGASREIGK